MDEKTKILYHGTDARFVRMSKEERMEYLNNQPTLADNLPLILFTFGTLANLIA